MTAYAGAQNCVTPQKHSHNDALPEVRERDRFASAQQTSNQVNAL
jgi:hypothetical protein